MRYFIDTEFNENGETIALISIAIVAEDGRELYLVSSEVCKENCQEWVQANVWPYLFANPHNTADRAKIRMRIEDFIGSDSIPEFWGYFADYDWVVFCWLWGAMISLPAHFPKFCLDLKQLAVSLGVAKPKVLVPAEQPEHNALADARWNAKLHAALVALEHSRP